MRKCKCPKCPKSKMYNINMFGYYNQNMLLQRCFILLSTKDVDYSRLIFVFFNGSWLDLPKKKAIVLGSCNFLIHYQKHIRLEWGVCKFIADIWFCSLSSLSLSLSWLFSCSLSLSPSLLMSVSSLPSLASIILVQSSYERSTVFQM